LNDDGHVTAAISKTRTNRNLATFPWPITPTHSPPKEFVVDRVAQGKTAGDLPKNCHLLPSAAILERQNPYTRCNRSIPSLPLEAVAAILGPAL
jgi:hypothetical protein